VAFQVENVATQGPSAANEVVAALERLDADDAIDVIVIARGGGSIEDLLPFSNESLIRAVAAARTPVVSAIGHETDAPLLDLVADLAASTPTDAARRIVPDVADERARVADLRERARQSIHKRLHGESLLLAGLRARMRDAVHVRLDREAADVATLRDRGRRRARAALEAAAADLTHVRARVRALSPQSTLDRGYAVVQRPDSLVVRDPDEAIGTLRIRVARGEFDAHKL
jgi:exodeoxyribonuclease VII large subunit